MNINNELIFYTVILIKRHLALVYLFIFNTRSPNLKKKMEKQRGHVLVVTYPAQGHINPLLQFTKRFASKGLKATLVTTQHTLNSIQPTKVDVEPISDGFDEGGFNQAPSVEAYLESFQRVGSKTLADIIIKYKNSAFPVNCIVYDSLMSWTVDVAKQFDICIAIIFTVSASVSSIFWQIHQGLLTLPIKQETETISLPGLPPLGLLDIPEFVAQPAKHPAYLAAIMDIYATLNRLDWLFCNSFEELESEVTYSAIVYIKSFYCIFMIYKIANSTHLCICFPKLVRTRPGHWPLQMVGPLVPSAYLDQRIEGDSAYGASLWKTSDQYTKWLDERPEKSVIYISFGSMADIGSKQVEEIVRGLKASNRPFLWAARDMEDKLQNGLADETGLVVSWCNQLEVLAHRAVGCYVTHCGWNSTLEGLSLGVPMVGMPHWSDQPTNAKLMEDLWKVGVRVKKDEEGIVSGEELMKCVEEVMAGEKSEEIKRNAAKWSDFAKKAVSSGGSSDRNIDDFVEKILQGTGKKLVQ